MKIFWRVTGNMKAFKVSWFKLIVTLFVLGILGQNILLIRQTRQLSGTQISMNLLRLTIPSPAFALLRGALAVAMQPEQATATAITSTNDLIRLSPEGKSIGANF